MTSVMISFWLLFLRLITHNFENNRMQKLILCNKKRGIQESMSVGGAQISDGEST